MTYVNSNQKKAGVAVLTDKIDFKTKHTSSDFKKVHFIIRRKSIHQEDITITNIYD